MGMRITIDLSDDDVLALLHDLPDDAAIRAWYKHLQAFKPNQSAERMDAEGKAIFDADPKIKSIPANRAERLRMLAKHPAYQNRAARDAAEEAALADRLRAAQDGATLLGEG